MELDELKKEAEEWVKEKIKENYFGHFPIDCVVAYIESAEPREKRIAELEAQIEKMKCCGNCIFSESDRLNGTFCHKEGCFVLASAKCKLWDN